MCFHQSVKCQCGAEEAFIFYRDNILPAETIIAIFCPSCSHLAKWDETSMIMDAGWIIHYDMDIARFFMKQKGIFVEPSPELLFYEEYCSWYGLSPKDIKANAVLSADLEHLKKLNIQMYFNAFKRRRLERVQELKEKGYLKALKA